jgi:hypothetical protein
MMTTKVNSSLTSVIPKAATTAGCARSAAASFKQDNHMPIDPDNFGGICNDGDLADRIAEISQRVAGFTDRTKLTRRAWLLWRIGNELDHLAERLESEPNQTNEN